MRQSQPGNSDTAVIISGGPLDGEYVLKLLEEYSGAYIIAAEKGCVFCIENGIGPDLVIGDFDTVGTEYEELAKRSGTDCVKLPSEKDVTDTFAAVTEAVNRGYVNIIVTGCFGGRADHSIANIKMLEEMAVRYPECRIVLCDKKNRMRVMTESFSISASEAPGYVSFFAIGGCVKGLTLKGFRYEIEDQDLEFYSHLCVSNETADGTAYVSFKEGMLLEVISED